MHKIYKLAKHQTDSVVLQPSNFFANGSAVDRYPVWLVMVTVMVMVVIRVAIRDCKLSTCNYNSNPRNFKRGRAY